MKHENLWWVCGADTNIRQGLLSRMYKELWKLITKTSYAPIQKWSREMKIHFDKEDITFGKLAMKDA